jgi:hypothetical protein
MKKQGATNHRRYYVPHHFVLYPLLFALLATSIAAMFRQPSETLEWKLFATAIAISGWISYMMRQHYALTLQNRIVRVEMRLRYFQITGNRFEPVEAKLSFGQIAALRFSSDEELLSLVEKTLLHDLPPGEIKKQIVDWQADHMRV